MSWLFANFGACLDARGYAAKGGQIIDASIVPVPVQRNSRDDNALIKSGQVPEEWQDNQSKLSQKDTDAGWTRKNGQNHFGYKNNINIDRDNKVVRRYEVTNAATHDSRPAKKLFDGNNRGRRMWGDKAYYSEEHEAWLGEQGCKSEIHRRGLCGKPLSKSQHQARRRKSKVRVCVEHVFAAQNNDMGGTLVRSIGMARAAARIGLKNLCYNIRRLAYLERRSRACSCA